MATYAASQFFINMNDVFYIRNEVPTASSRIKRTDKKNRV